MKAWDFPPSQIDLYKHYSHDRDPFLCCYNILMHVPSEEKPFKRIAHCIDCTSQWKKCFAKVSFDMYSATNKHSSPSQQHPIKFTNLSWRNWPIALPFSSVCLWMEESAATRDFAFGLLRGSYCKQREANHTSLVPESFADRGIYHLVGILIWPLTIDIPHAANKQNDWYSYIPNYLLCFDDKPKAIHIRTLAWDLAHCVGSPYHDLDLVFGLWFLVLWWWIALGANGWGQGAQWGLNCFLVK